LKEEYQTMAKQKDVKGGVSRPDKGAGISIGAMPAGLIAGNNTLNGVLDRAVVALGLPGGGARGPYQVGAYRAMHERGIMPDIVACISIGALIGVIIAGNKPENRLAKLNGFWNAITRTEYWDPFFLFPKDLGYAMRHRIGAGTAMVFGVDNFFKPWGILPDFAPRGSKARTSYYDTSPMYQTLLKFVDWEWLNSPDNPVRYLCGAVKVKTGQLVFFDSKKQTITPAHVMASGALPPAFPGVVIDGDLYWDGGCHSNDVTESIFGCVKTADLTLYLPTLFSMEGNEPTTMEELETRKKEIQYASRYRLVVQNALRERALRNALARSLELVPTDERAKFGTLVNMGRRHSLEIVHTEYDAPKYEGPYNDTDFDRKLTERREAEGYKDMSEAIAKRAA
jgi:NTE family protein